MDPIRFVYGSISASIRKGAKHVAGSSREKPDSVTVIETVHINVTDIQDFELKITQRL